MDSERRVAGSRNIDARGHEDRGENITATLLGKVSRGTLRVILIRE